MSKQRIEYPITSQVQVGDWVEGTYKGHEFAGEVWESQDDELFAGAALLRWADGKWDSAFEITAITRDVPDLPTKPGTVGRATVRGVPNVRIMRTNIQGGWVSGLRVNEQQFHGEQHIDHSTLVLELEGDGNEELAY